MPTLYRIAKWRETYETHETRKLVRLNWIPVPNKHDGLGFRMIAAEKDGAALFGAWNLIVQVASKADREHRGTLVRDEIPLTSNSLAMMTGFPEKLFERALAFFSQPRIGWIVAEQWQTDLPLSPDAPGDCPGNLPDEGKGMEGKGKKEGKEACAAGAAPQSLSLESLKADPTYAGIDIDREHGKALVWCKANNRTLTMRRFVNWLNKCDRPLGNGQPPKRKSLECPGWKTILNHEFPDSAYSAGQRSEAHEWTDLPPEAQQLCWQTYKKQGAA